MTFRHQGSDIRKPTYDYGRVWKYRMLFSEHPLHRTPSHLPWALSNVELVHVVHHRTLWTCCQRQLSSDGIPILAEPFLGRGISVLCIRKSFLGARCLVELLSLIRPLGRGNNQCWERVRSHLRATLILLVSSKQRSGCIWLYLYQTTDVLSHGVWWRAAGIKAGGDAAAAAAEAAGGWTSCMLQKEVAP